MSGSALLFMTVSWLIVFGFVVFCLTVILREGKRESKPSHPAEFFDQDREEIT